jgi:carboxymethylenebutenolidase
MSELESIQRPDGNDCPAYLARPAGGARGGVVVVQEWWGLNAQIKATADRLAAAGYLALVPDLYRGVVVPHGKADEAGHRMNELDFADAANQDIRGAVRHLKASGTRVAVLGFCMGGALTILSAMWVPEMDAGVCFYGIPPAEAGDPATIQTPLQLHFANHDDWCNPKAVDALEAKLTAGGVTHELHRYDAQHAFMNEGRPEVYDEAAAKLAWTRTLSFLGKQLAAS